MAQLKRDDERGATGDKVPMLDPGAAQLGTDDEAAGATPPPGKIAAVRGARREAQPSPEHPADRPGAAGGRRLLGALALAVALAAAALWLSSA